MSEVSENLEKFKNKQLPELLEQAMQEACVLVMNDAMQQCPHDTGNLDGSIDFKVENINGSVEGCVYTNVEYAPYVELGTGIYATQGGGRKTPWKYKGSHGWVTTSGSKAQPFLEPAAKNNQNKIRNCFKGLV